MKKLISTLALSLTLATSAFAEGNDPDGVVTGPSDAGVLAEMAFSGDEDLKNIVTAYVVGVFELGYTSGIFCPKSDTTRSIIANLGLFALRHSPASEPAALSIGKVFMQALPCDSNGKPKNNGFNPPKKPA